MLKSMSILLSKNPAKLLSLYDINDDEDTKIKVIDKLKQLKAIPELVQIARIDETNRSSIVLFLLKYKLLDEISAESIFSWLNISKLHSEIINHIKLQFNKEQVLYLLRSTKINPNAKKNMEYIYSILGKNNKNQVTPDEKYLKLKMIYENYDIGEDELNYLSNNFKDEINLQEVIIKFLNEIKILNDEDKLKYIAETIKEVRAKHALDKTLIFLFINLADLSISQVVNLINYCKDSFIYFPDVFNMLTEFKTIPYEPLHNLFSTPVMKKWIIEYFESSYYFDLLFLKTNFEEFKQISVIFKKSELMDFAESLNIEEKCNLQTNDFDLSTKMLTNRFKLCLFDLINDSQILDNLDRCCQEIQKSILANINTDLAEVKKLCKALLIVGGDNNLIFLNNLAKKKPVDNIKQTLQDIEQKYLLKKKNTTTPIELQKLIDEELKEKNSLIPSETYHFLLQTIIEYIAIMSNFNEEKREFLKENLDFRSADSATNHTTGSLDALTIFINNSSSEGKIIACQLIRKLQLSKYIPYLEKFLDESDVKLALYSAIALKTFNNDKATLFIKKLSQSKKTSVRKQLASLIHIFKKNLDDDLILTLTCDENASISEEAIKSISQLPKNIALDFYEQIIKDIPQKNKSILAKFLGETRSKRAISLLIEILNNGDFFDYKNVIKALISIKEPVCLDLLQNMELKKNFTLELEKCRGLIILGDYHGWNEIKKFFGINQSNINFLAKLYFIELANFEQLEVIRELCLDSDNKISTLAISKVLYFSENEGINLINEVLNNENYNKIYYTAQLLDQLPFAQISKEMEKLNKKEELKCKTINALIHAKNGNLKPLNSIERSILNFNDGQNTEILEAVADYPTKEALSILKKMTILQNSQINEQILKIISNDKDSLFANKETIDKFIIDFWDKSDFLNRKIIINYICENKNHYYYEFLKDVFDNNLNQLQVHIARALILYGDEEYWTFLEQMTMSNEHEVKLEAIEAISHIEEKKAFTILSKLLSSPSETILIEIIKTLANSCSRDIVTLLKKFVDSSSSKVKIAVAKTLGSFPYTESKNLLEKLKMERDEYLSVAVEIAMEKIEKNSDFHKITFNKLIDMVLGNANLFVSEDFVLHNYSMLKTQYAGFQNKPLEEFAGKTILDINQYNKRKKKIDESLEAKMLGNSNVENILKLKNNATNLVNNMALKEELIVSLLNLNNHKPDKESAKIIFDIIKSQDETFIKAFILATAKSTETAYLSFYEKILNLSSSNKYLDFILYSMTNKLDSNSVKSVGIINLILKFLDNDKVKYYFVYLINYFSINKSLLTKDKCAELIKEISDYDIEENTKKSCIKLISLLL